MPTSRAKWSERSERTTPSAGPGRERRGGADRAVAAGRDDQVAIHRLRRRLADPVEILGRHFGHLDVHPARGEQLAEPFDRVILR